MTQKYVYALPRTQLWDLSGVTAAQKCWTHHSHSAKQSVNCQEHFHWLHLADTSYKRRPDVMKFSRCEKKIPEFPCDLFLSILLNTYRHCSVTKMFIHFYIIFLGKPYNSGYTRNGRHRSNKYGETDDGLSPKCSGFCLCDKCSFSWWISKRQGIQCYIFLLL